MTVTIVKPDEEVIIDVDLEDEISCDFKNDKGDCGRPAEWLMVRKCCGFHEHKCNVHKETTINFLSHAFGVVACVLCGHIQIMPKIADIYSYIGRL